MSYCLNDAVSSKHNKDSKMKNLCSDTLGQYRLAPIEEKRIINVIGDDKAGVFTIPHPPTGARLRVIASAGHYDWDHVSVSISHRCPDWLEMSFIKDLFFEPEDTVMQLHPPKSEYVNNHVYCLHLWRPLKEQAPLPPSILVGIKSLTPEGVKEILKARKTR
jgi:hypothetical protein